MALFLSAHVLSAQLPFKDFAGLQATFIVVASVVHSSFRGTGNIKKEILNQYFSAQLVSAHVLSA